MSKFKVVLTNSSIGITVGSALVAGHSGCRYGYSAYSDAYRCHAIEMTPEQYEKAAPDLARGWHKAMCKWVPHFVEIESNVVTPDTNEELRRICMESARKLSAEDIIAIAREHGLIITAVPIEPIEPVVKEYIGAGAPVEIARRPDAPAAYTEGIGTRTLVVGISDPLPDRYWSLIKIAKDEGVNVEGLKKIPALQEAILNHRQRKAA